MIELLKSLSSAKLRSGEACVRWHVLYQDMISRCGYHLSNMYKSFLPNIVSCLTTDHQEMPMLISVGGMSGEIESWPGENICWQDLVWMYKNVVVPSSCNEVQETCWGLADWTSDHQASMGWSWGKHGMIMGHTQTSLGDLCVQTGIMETLWPSLKYTSETCEDYKQEWEFTPDLLYKQGAEPRSSVLTRH